MPETKAPWLRGLGRKSPRGARHAARQARAGQFWGDRTAQARKQGPAAMATVSWDRLRTTVANLPDDHSAPAWKRVHDALESLRQEVGSR